VAGWTACSIPAQRGRVAIVTGTGGLGFETALELARAGANVILAGRDADRAASVAKLRAATNGASMRFEMLDLACLTSVKAFGTRIQDERPDLLVDNAGVMAPPTRKVTTDGFELQFGTNSLGHFALTAQLFHNCGRDTSRASSRSAASAPTSETSTSMTCSPAELPPDGCL